MLFNQPNPPANSSPNSSPLTPRVIHLTGTIAIFALISAATASMMLCPCDTVGIRDYRAISLMALAVLFAIAAAFLIYRRMRSDSGITAFLRAVIAISIAGFAVYLELYAAMEMVAWLARPR